MLRGLDNAGKSTIVQRWLNLDITSVSPTFGFAIKSLHYQHKYHLNIWDIGGQKSIRAYWRNYYEQTDGLVWVVDASTPSQLEECKRELDILLEQDRLMGASLLILANKQDVAGSIGEEEIGRVLELERLHGRVHYKVMACSGLTEMNVQKSLDWLVADISEKTFRF